MRKLLEIPLGYIIWWTVVKQPANQAGFMAITPHWQRGSIKRY